jgi:hypothetical protein
MDTGRKKMSEVIWDGPHSRVIRLGPHSVIKQYKCWLEFGVHFREEWWWRQYGSWRWSDLRNRRQYGLGHRFRAHATGTLEMPWMGARLTADNLPRSWKAQADAILRDLDLSGCFHNDINPGNLLLFRGRIELIDFGWATTRHQPVPDIWPKGLGGKYKGDNGFNDAESMAKSIQAIKEGTV